MKITKERLIEIIKEEIQNSQISEKFERPRYGSDEYRAMQRDLNDKYDRTLTKVDGRMQWVNPPAWDEMVKDLQDLGREDVIAALGTLNSISIYMIAEVDYYAKTKDMEGLDSMVRKAKGHGAAVIRSGPLGT